MLRRDLDSVLSSNRTWVSRRTLIWRSTLTALAALGVRRTSAAQDKPATPEPPAHAVGDWPAYGRDPGGGSHSSLAQIDRDNVHRLDEAWTFRTGELETYEGTNFPTSATAFEAVPLMVDGVLYVCTATARTFALDAATGQQLWAYDPGLDLNVNYSNPVSRGVSTWVDAAKNPSDPGRRTIFVGTIDARLIGLDAATGNARPDFGDDGVINLRAAAAPEGGCHMTRAFSPVSSTSPRHRP